MDIHEVEKKVGDAITGLKAGETKEFTSLTALLSSKELDCDTVALYMKALKKSMQYITKEHEILVGVVLNIDWSKLDLVTNELFIEFVTELVSAKTYYLKVCIRSLIKKFLLKSVIDIEESSDWKEKLDNVHVALKAISTLVPLASKSIIESIVKNFPYIGKDLFILENYIVNILQISTYVTDARYAIVSLCVEKLMSIDVRIPRTHLEDRDGGDENEADVVLQFEGDLPPEKKINTHEVNIDKLDQLMLIFFTYIHSVCHIEDVLDVPLAHALFKELMIVFDDVMLKTQQSSHVQYVIFYFASFHKKFSEAFIATCWRSIENPNVPSIIRQSAAGYLSSFLARAKYVDLNTVKEQLKALSAWLHRYMDLQDGNNICADFDKHGPFYSTCQALFYVFIYHHKDLLSTREQIECIKSLNFMRLVTSKLNPLKFCLSTVVNMFARITRMYEIVFCYSVIERNNRNVLSELTFATNNTVLQSNRMEMFFPFDPYMLPKSKAVIKPLYLEWTGSVVDEDSDSDDEEDIDSDLADLHIDKHSHHNGASEGFDMMCISPGFSLIHQD